MHPQRVRPSEDAQIELQVQEHPADRICDKRGSDSLHPVLRIIAQPRSIQLLPTCSISLAALLRRTQDQAQPHRDIRNTSGVLQRYAVGQEDKQGSVHGYLRLIAGYGPNGDFVAFGGGHHLEETNGREGRGVFISP